MANKICISLCTFLNFACVTIIGDNVDTEKSVILMLNIVHALFESMSWQVNNSF